MLSLLRVFCLHFVGTAGMFAVQSMSGKWIFSWQNYWSEEKGWDYPTSADNADNTTQSDRTCWDHALTLLSVFLGWLVSLFDAVFWICSCLLPCVRSLPSAV